MVDLVSVFNQIDAARAQALLVEAVNHYSPSYAEAAVIPTFVQALNKARIPHRLQPVPVAPGDTERANILVELGPTPPELLLIGHIDTIPYWGDEDEHGAFVEGDVLYGLGSADMKSGCVAMVEALTALIEAGATFERGVCLALVVGEEEYGDGSAALLDEILAPLTIIGEPTSLTPCTEHYGYLELRLTSEGTRAHAALPSVGANAIHAMLTWLLQLLERVGALEQADRISVNPRQITGGENLFVIAERCEAAVDLHLAADVDRELLLALVDEAREAALATHPSCALSFEEIFWVPGYSLSDDDTFLPSVREAFAAAGVAWNPVAFPSHSDGNLFFQHGTVPIVCGPGALEVAHTRDEHVHLPEVVTAARLYAALIHQVCVRR
jgi:acetylornithine deacetylase